MKRPLLMVALCYATGVVLADLVPAALPVFPFLAITLLLASIALVWAKVRPWLIWVVVFLTGACGLNLHKAVLSPHDLRSLMGDEPQIVEVRGHLRETPYQRVYDHHDEQVWRTMAELQVTSLRVRNGPVQPAFGRVLVVTPGIVTAPFFGGRSVLLEGVLRPPKSAPAEGLFDYRKFLARQTIYHQLQVSSASDWRLSPDADPKAVAPLADRFASWAKAALARGLPEEDEPLRLLWAMTLGWKTALNGEVAEPFMRSGTMHVFAISGLHIALIAGLLVMVFRVFHLPRAWCGLLVIPLIWCYTGVTGWQASAIRSTIMMSVLIAGWSLRRPSDLLNSLAAAAFIILLWNPQQLFQAGFQLSFCVVLSLALFTPVLENLRQRILAPDPFLPEELLPGWRRWLGPPLNSLTTGLVVSMAAWLGSIPLIAAYFHLFTPISLLANLLVVPVSSAALACNLASLISSALVPHAAELFNHSAWFFMWLMIRLSHWAAEVPGGAVHVSSPPAVAFAFYYLFLGSLMAGGLIRPKWRLWLGGILGLLGMIWLIQDQSHRSLNRLTILPISGGAAIYFQPSREANDLLIDCGNDSAVDFVLKPYLRAQGVNHLRSLLLTHGDVHHVGGARRIQEEFAPRRIFCGEVPFRSKAYRETVDYLERSPALVVRARRDTSIGAWTVLHPDRSDSFPQADDNCLALLGHLEGLRVLLLSDLGRRGQNALLERYPALQVDVVISGIPNQSEPLAESFLDSIKPRLIIVTDSEYPATQRASRSVRERLRGRNIPVLYTRETGAIDLIFREQRLDVKTMSGTNLTLTADRAPSSPELSLDSVPMPAALRRMTKKAEGVQQHTPQPEGR